MILIITVQHDHIHNHFTDTHTTLLYTLDYFFSIGFPAGLTNTPPLVGDLPCCTTLVA